MTQSIERTTPAIDEAPQAIQFRKGDRVRIIKAPRYQGCEAEVVNDVHEGTVLVLPDAPDAMFAMPVWAGHLELIAAAEPEPEQPPAIDEEDEDEGPDLKVGDRVWYGEPTNTGIISDLQYPDVAVRFDHGSTVTVAYHRLHPVEVLVEFSDGSTVIVEQGAHYTPGFLAEEEAAQLLEFSEALDWQHNSFRIFGKETKLPRLEIMFGDAGCTYRYSNVELEPLPWPPELQALRERVEAATGCKYQVVIGNLYRSGADHIGWHADDSKEMGENPAIASISLGATRRFDVRSKADGETQSFELASGDLVFMPSGFQSTHKHRIAKTSKETGVRINWTFRPHVGGMAIAINAPTQAITPEVIPSDPGERLTQLEGEILEGMKLVEQGKAKVWQAVAAIRAENLWELNGHKSFKEYVQVRFGWKESYAHEIAAAGEQATQLIASGVPESILPDAADAYRHTKKLAPEQAAEAIQKAAEAAGGKPTAKAVKAAVAEIQGKSKPITPALDPLPPECKPSITPEEFNAAMRESAEARSAGCMSCRHQRMTGSGDRYSCEQKEFEGTLLLKENWFVENEGCKNYSHPAAEPQPNYYVPKGVGRLRMLPDGSCEVFGLVLTEQQQMKAAALARTLDGSLLTAIQHLIDQLPEVVLDE